MELGNPRLFIKGLSSEVKETNLQEHFNRFGEVIDVLIIPQTNFGFVTFSDPSMAQNALEQEHIILGREVEVKAAKPKGHICERKIFVGGLPRDITLEAFRQYFGAYGNITDAVVMYGNETKRSRGFGFVTYDSKEVAKRVLENRFHRLQDKMVEVKKAKPKQQMLYEPGGFGHNPGPGHIHGSIYDVNSQPHCDTSYWPSYYPCWYGFYGGYYQQPWGFDQTGYYVLYPYWNDYTVETYYQPFPCADSDCQHPYCNNNRM